MDFRHAQITLMGDRRYRHLIPPWVKSEFSLIVWLVSAGERGHAITRVFGETKSARRIEPLQGLTPTRKPPSSRALRRARTMAPALIRSF